MLRVSTLSGGPQYIYPGRPDLTTRLDVWYDEKTDRGGWVVFQRRVNGLNTTHNWAAYRNGFGIALDLGDIEF